MSEDGCFTPGSKETTESTTQQDDRETTVAETHATQEKRTLLENAGPGTSQEGWSKLTEHTYVCQLHPIRENKVFRGKHKLLGEWRDIAVKIIDYDDKSYEEVLGYHELKENRNVVQIYEVGKLPGIVPKIFIAMELCSLNLKDFTKTPNRVFDFELCSSFAKQIVSGVAFLHQGKVLHRDIKLENIFLSKSEDSVQVAGFGLSKRILTGHLVATVSTRGVCSDENRAPELLQKNPKATVYSDSFSLGIVLAMLFSEGHHPFGSDPSRWRPNIADNTGLDLSHILMFEEPYTYKAMLLADLIKRCLRKKPKTRPTPEEMLSHGFFTDTGEGWVRLSEKTYMCQLQPIRENKVYKGKHRDAGGEWRDVAIKLIYHDDKSFEEVKHHLELKKHPTIIEMYEADITQQGIINYIYIAMELCSQTLKEFIEERKQSPFDFKLYLSFAKQVVSGVAYIHECNILHRDIKLENILLSISMDKVRVADFGLSRQIPAGSSIVNATHRGMGSDGYRAPELFDENPQASFYSDSFALGIVLAMLFSHGQHPYGPDPSRWLKNICDNINRNLSNVIQFKEPHTHKRALLIDLIEKCLQRKPKDRPKPKAMLQHGFFTDAKKDQPAKIPPMLQQDKDGAADNTHADLMEQFLKTKEVKVKKLEESLAQAIKNGDPNYGKVLEELRSLGSADDLDTILPLAEYDLISKKNDSIIEKVADIINRAGSRSAMDIRQKGYNLQQQAKFVQSMILYILCHDLHKKEGRYAPDVELQWLEHRISDITSAIDPMIDTGGSLLEVAKRHGIKHILALMDDVRAVEGATPGAKALHEMGCLVNITGNLNHIRDHERCIRYGEEGVAMMERQFGENAVFYKDYGRMLNNLANAYGNYGRQEKAEQTYHKALEIHDKAVDYEDEGKREKDRGSTTHNLGNTHHKILGHPSSSLAITSESISRKIIQG